MSLCREGIIMTSWARKKSLVVPLVAVFFILAAGRAHAPRAAEPAEEPEFLSSKVIDGDACAVAVDEVERRLKPGVLCKADECRGSAVQLNRNKPLIEDSRVSEADCIKKLDAAMDTTCVNKNQPGNCTGNCPPGSGQECKNAGMALGISTKKIGNLWVCASSRALCACRCR